MLRDHFQRSTSTLNNLRSEHFKVSEYLNKGRYRMKQKFFGKGKKHYDFDINSQQFFHQYIDDIIFEPTEIQQIFYNEINKSLEHPVTFNNKMKITDNQISTRKNPSEVRVLLARHFHNRSNDLRYKKYLTMLRMHNYGEEQYMTAAKSRTNLIDKQIQQCLNRQSRLQVEDYFQSSYTQGGKPVPVNQNGQPIYKYIDQQDCWFSNIARDDIQAYLRNILFQEDVLNSAYWPYWYQCQYLVNTHGLQICNKIEQQIAQSENKIQQSTIIYAKKIIAILEKGLQEISPGNLQQKQNLTNFIYGITGINYEKPVHIPLYPGIFMELTDNYNKIMAIFFKNLHFNSHKQIIQCVPKFNSFCSILFKYQNQQILQGEKQIKLGLQDEIDIRKQLITMLQQQWVTKHVKINFNRFQYKMYLKPMDWALDNLSQRLQKQLNTKDCTKYANDFTLQQLIRTMRLTTYGDFRKIIRKRSQKIVERASKKYQDMELVQKYSTRTDQQMNMEKLIDLYQAKGQQLRQLFKINLLKENTKKFFTLIMKDSIITNPVEIQISQTLVSIRIRQIRTRILNILNAIRCYQRNIDLDLRVIDGCQFKFQMDDDFLINSNKQTVQKFEKTVKQNETSLSKAHSGVPTIQNEDFLVRGSLQKPLLYKKDQVQKNFFDQTLPHIFVTDGKKKKKILYDIALKDLELVQKRILQNGTFFVNKYERIIKVKQLPQIVDRIQVLSELFQLEEQYLYEKLNLIEAYYYLYQNTVEPLNAHKIGKTIIEIMYQQPKIDQKSSYFKSAYEIKIQALKEETKVIKLYTKKLQDEQKQKNKVFHKKFANMCEIPLTLWAYAYCDMQIKGAKNYSKLQRMNSVSSKMSKNSKSEKQKNVINDLKNQIREQFGEQSEEQQQQFNIEQYDEYMLKRNMDDIFEDIVGADAPKQPKDKDAGLGVSSLGIQNLTVNPKFQGGPHVLHNYLPDIKITSSQNQKLLNFTQNLCWISNIHNLILKLTKEARDRYGYCCQQYQLRLTKQICSMMNKILLTHPQKVQTFHQFQTDDFYYQTVTLDSKAFEDAMHPILDLPSILQLSMQSTHEKHQNTLPSHQILHHFDFNILTNLVKLQKPLNSAVYRQLNLSINLIQFVKIRQQITHIYLQRQQILNSYRVLGLCCDVPIEKYASCYGRSGQSEVFLASSEAKIYDSNYLKRPCFNQSIQALRNFYQLQLTQLNLFRNSVELAKAQIEDYIRISWDMQRKNKNYVLNRNDVLLSTDKKNVKMISNRVKGHANALANQILKTKCYLKYKSKLKVMLEEKIKNVQDLNIQDLILKHFLNNDTKKYNKNCVLLLAQKMKRRLCRQYLRKYTADLKVSIANNQIFLQLLKCSKKIGNYAKSLPYLEKIFTLPTQFQQLNKKAFYDQKKLKIVEQQHDSEVQGIYYVESKEQLIEDWGVLFHSANSVHLEDSINYQNYIKASHPPSSKDEIFKWMFKIPSNSINDKEKESLKHILRICEPYTGKISASQYRYSIKEKGSRNKFWQLYEKYSIIIEYIETNIILICLQSQGDIIESIVNIINHEYKFQQKYPLLDQAAIYESVPKQAGENYQPQYLNDSPLTSAYLINNRKAQFDEKLKQKIDEKRYSEKNKHFAVQDEIFDFVTAKVQSYGVIRHCMLQLKDQMSFLKKNNKPEAAFKYMRSKAENIFIMLWLSLWRTLNSKIDSEVNLYTPLFLDTLIYAPKLESFQTPQNNNCRRGVNQFISYRYEQKEQQKLKFEKGIYDTKNDFLVSKLKAMFNYLPINLGDYIQQFIFKSQNDAQQRINTQSPIAIFRHNWNFIESFIDIIKKPNKQFRYNLFSKMRQLFDMGKDFLQTKSDQLDKNLLLELEEKKTGFFQYLMQGKIYILGLTAFKISKFSQSFPDSPGKFWQAFHDQLEKTKQMIDINTFSIYDQLQAYKSSGKIVFSKLEQNIIATHPKISKMSKQYNNKLVRMVIFNKLTVQQFKNEVLQTTINLLKAEKIPKSQNKKIQNSSLIPRVHLISSFSSPLIVQRKTYISQQYKLAFVQAFINRFRNKVSRVDLLSSGYGFVITVPDLQDCVNYMNKLLFTFTEKQFRVRLETFSQYYEILMDGIRTRNQTINQQNSIIKYLQAKVKNTLQAQYLAKVSKLLQEKVLMQQKLRLAQQSSNGLQHRVRKAIQHEYDMKISSLQRQNKQLAANFEQFKDILIKLTKDTTKNNFLHLVNILKDQASKTLDKKVDLSESFKAISEITNETKGQKQVVKQQQVAYNTDEKEEKEVYDQSNIQRCKIGEQIIHDPYYVTKLINKMRVFNLFKMGAKKLKYQAKQQKKIEQLTSLHKIQDRVIAQSERQNVLRSQLTKAHEQLSKKSVELQKIRHTIEALENEKAKLKILLVTKQKKIQQKQRQNQQIKKKIVEQKSEAKLQSKSSIIQVQEEQLPRISAVRQQKKSIRKITRQPFLTNLDQRSASLSLYEKFELSNKDSTWRQKCQQLYLQNKKLLNQLEKLKQGYSGAVTPNTRQGYSLNLRNRRTGDQSQNTSRTQKRKFANLSFKYGVMKG